MQFVKRMVTARREFLICQFSGFGMIGAGVTIFERPASLTFSWFDSLYHLSIAPIWWSVLFVSFGWILAWHQHVSHRIFFVLTIPILVYSSIQWIFFFTNSSAGSTPGYWTTLLFISLQYIHVRQEAWTRWTKMSETS